MPELPSGTVTSSAAALSDPASSTNFAEFCDPEIDARIERAFEVQAEDPQAANEVWAEIDRAIVDEAPFVPLYNPRAIDFVSKRVGNYQRHPLWGVLLSQL